jgi:ribosomal protein S18 acetylase RimI-like enzyme
MTIETGFTADQLQGITEVFWLTAQREEFASDDERHQYYHRWAGGYLEEYPDWVYTAQEDGKILGYLLGCPDSTQALSVLDFPGLDLFQDFFDRFPAHLHINVHPQGQGMGIGRRLIEAYCGDLKKSGSPGVHLITTADAKNPGFYRAVGFNFEHQHKADTYTLLFMGRSL